MALTGTVTAANLRAIGTGTASTYWCNSLQRYYLPISREDTVLKFQIEPP